MLNRKLALALVLAAFTPVLFGQGCGGSSSSPDATGKAGKDGGTAGTGTAGTTAGTSAAGTTAGTSAAGTAGPDAAAGTGGGAGADGGADVMVDATVEPMKPDGQQGVTWAFATTAQGWHYSIYGSTPNGMPNAANNLATLSGMPVWDGTNDADNMTTSGSLKSTVQFRAVGDRIDIQAFSVGAGMYDWTGYKVAGKVKLVSGGNLTPGCPLKAFFYLSGPMPGYTTTTSASVDLVTGSWVSLAYDTGDAGGVDLTKISQLGIQITTGDACTGTTPDGGADAGADAAAEAGSDAAAEAGSDAADGGADDASDASTDLLVDAGLGDVIDATATDAGDAAEAAVAVPPTAGTAVILIDNVIVSVK